MERPLDAPDPEEQEEKRAKSLGNSGVELWSAIGLGILVYVSARYGLLMRSYSFWESAFAGIFVGVLLLLRNLFVRYTRR